MWTGKVQQLEQYESKETEEEGIPIRVVQGEAEPEVIIEKKKHKLVLLCLLWELQMPGQLTTLEPRFGTGIPSIFRTQLDVELIISERQLKEMLNIALC